MNDPFLKKRKRFALPVVIVLGVLFAGAALFSALLLIRKTVKIVDREISKRGEWRDDDNPLNYCSNDDDCYIFGYQKCGCIETAAINIRYKDDKEAIKKAFGLKSVTGFNADGCGYVCGMPYDHAEEARCRFGKCQLKWVPNSYD